MGSYPEAGSNPGGNDCLVKRRLAAPYPSDSSEALEQSQILCADEARVADSRSNPRIGEYYLSNLTNPPMCHVMSPIVRSVTFRFDASFEPSWHPRLPEFACVANSVSLIMPYAEPYIARSVRQALPLLGEDLREEAKAYIGQEMQHQAQHRKFNDLVVGQSPRLSRVERAMAWTFRHLETHRSLSFNLAFAPGFETLAYTGARWTEKQLGHLFDDADPVASSLFLWHLAEEVEHKNVAYDVFHAASGKKLSYLTGMLSSTLMLIFFTWWSTWILLFDQRQLLRPAAHWHLFLWSFGFAFDLFPALFVSIMPSHHPSDLADPTWFRLWLECYDPKSRSIPLWNGSQPVCEPARPCLVE